MEIQSYVDALSAVLGQQVEAGSDGSYAFLLDNVPVLLHFGDTGRRCLLHMDIGYPTTLGGMHARLLGANFLLAETAGAALSLNDQTGMACLEYVIAVSGLDAADFVAQVERFVALADLWTARLEEWNAETEGQVTSRLDAFLQGMENGESAGGAGPEAGAFLRV